MLAARFILSAALLACTACESSQRLEPAPRRAAQPDSAPPAPAFPLETPVRTAVTVRGEFTPKRYVEIPAARTSRVVSVETRLGVLVQAGDPIMTVETAREERPTRPATGSGQAPERRLDAVRATAAARHAALESARSDAEVQEREFARINELHLHGLIARLDFEAARQARDAALEAARAARGDHEAILAERDALADQLRAEQASKQAGASNEPAARTRVLRAPIEGYVVRLPAVGGSPSENPAVLAEAEGLIVRFPVAAVDGLEQGEKVLVETAVEAFQSTAERAPKSEGSTGAVAHIIVRRRLRSWNGGICRVTLDALPIN